mgnify:CR=1 FL=1
MNMNSRQSEAVTRLYTAALKTAESEDAMLRILSDLDGGFSSAIPRWADRLREDLQTENLCVAEAALDDYLQRQITAEEDEAQSHSANVELVTYEPDPVAEAKRAADHKEYVDRRMKYICAMGLVNAMYQQERISLREYRDLEDCFARFYRFTDGSLERWRKPPEDSVFVDLHGAKPSKRTYTQRTAEYWKNFTCPAKRKTGMGDEQNDR